MCQNQYLADVLSTANFKRRKLNIIEAPCGCGKTTAAINVISKLASSPKKALYLIDTRNGFERLAKNERLNRPYCFYEYDIKYASFPAEEEGDPTKIVVTTYAQFGVWVSHTPDFADYFELIICDELHNLPAFAAMSEEPNHTSIARDAIYKVARSSHTLVVGITATPGKLKDLSFAYSVPIDISRLKQYQNHDIRYYASLEQVIAQIPKGTRGALYIGHISQIKQYEKIASDAGFRPICIWSAANEKYPMNEEQFKARRYILENEAVPPEYDLLIFNASCETSINLYGQMDYMIIHSNNPTHRIQARGRYRGDLDSVYYYDCHNGKIIVPEEYLNKRLFQQEKKEFREKLGLKDAKGHLLAFKTLRERLEANGYTITEGRENNRRYIVITKAESCGPVPQPLD